MRLRGLTFRATRSALVACILAMCVVDLGRGATPEAWIDKPRRLYFNKKLDVVMALPSAAAGMSNAVAGVDTGGFLVVAQEPGGGRVGLGLLEDRTLDALSRWVGARAGGEVHDSTLDAAATRYTFTVKRSGTTVCGSAEHVSVGGGSIVLYYEILTDNRRCLEQRLEQLRSAVVPLHEERLPDPLPYLSDVILDCTKGLPPPPPPPPPPPKTALVKPLAPGPAPVFHNANASEAPPASVDEGTVVEVVARRGSYVKIRHDGVEGWMRNTDLVETP